MILAPSRRWLWPALLLVIVTVAAYWPITTYGFTDYDDPEYVTENPHVLAGITANGVVWAFTTGHAGNWHPVTWLCHMLDVQVFGLRAGGHHATSLLLHALNAVLLFLVLRRMTGATWRSFFVGALFALHPTHVESVAWVAERKDVLSAFFAMLTLGAYALYVERPSVKRYGAVTVIFAFGLMAKPMLVTLPFLLLLLDLWPLRRFDRERNNVGALVIEKVPLLGLAAASSLITMMVQRGATTSFEAIAFWPRAANAIVSYCRYAGKTIWPNPLSVFYAHPLTWPIETVLLAGVVVAALTALAVMLARTAPYALVGWLWFLGSLVPVIGLVQVGRQAMADRYTYLPAIGLFIAIVWGAHAICRSWRIALVTAAVLGVVASGGLFALTRHQVAYWRDPISLWSHAVAVDPADPIARNNLGFAKWHLGDVQGAVAEFDQAIQISPLWAESYNNLGMARMESKQSDLAEKAFSRAIEVNPAFAAAFNNRARVRVSRGDIASGLADYERALLLDPGLVEALYNRALAKSLGGDVGGALEDYGRALRVKPCFVEALTNRANLLLTRGDTQAALADYDAAITCGGPLATTYLGRAVAKSTLHDVAGALADCERALEIDPSLQEAATLRKQLAP